MENSAPRAQKWRNPNRHLPKVRWVIQASYAAFLVLVGYEFATWLSQLLSGQPVTAHRPAAVEAFLPISALLGLKRFLLTGQWDQIHPAGLTIFVAALVSAFVARKAFCSWVCPVGGLSRFFEWYANEWLWRRRWPRVPRWLDLPLSGLKYLVAGFFVWAVWKMSLQDLETFMGAPYNAAADGKMLLFFKSPSGTTAVVLFVLGALSLVVRNFWCRYLCPYGAVLGLASFLSPLHVRRNVSACNDCGACNRACPVELPVAKRVRVLSPECTGCLSCVAACPVKDALGVTHPKLPAWSVPVAALSIMFGAYAVARLTGNWETELPLRYLQMAYRALGIQ